MKVKQLIEVLQTYNPDHDIVISCHDGLGFRCDFDVGLVQQYNETNYVLLMPGKVYEEHEQ